MGIIFKEKPMVDEVIKKGGCVDPSHKHTSTWNLVVPVSALVLLGTLMLTVSNTAAVGLSLAEQHGESIVLMQKQIDLMQQEIKGSYTDKDAERDLDYIKEDIKEIKEMIKEAHRVQ